MKRDLPQLANSHALTGGTFWKLDNERGDMDIEKRENEWQFVDGDGGKSVDETVHVGGVLVTDGGENVVGVDLVDTGERGGEGCHAGLDVCGVRRNI